MSYKGKNPRDLKSRSLPSGAGRPPIPNILRDMDEGFLCANALRMKQVWGKSEVNDASVRRTDVNVRALKVYLQCLQRSALEETNMNVKEMVEKLTNPVAPASEMTHAQMAELDDEALIDAIFVEAEPAEIVARVDAIKEASETVSVFSEAESGKAGRELTSTKLNKTEQVTLPIALSQRHEVACVRPSTGVLAAPVVVGSAVAAAAVTVGGPVVCAGLGVSAVAHVNSSINNTKILISDVQGNAISWSSAGTMGFKGSRKCTPYAAQMAAEDAGKKAYAHGVKTLEVEVHGPGAGRESALRALAAVGFNITSIRDVVPTAMDKGNFEAGRSVVVKKDAG